MKSFRQVLAEAKATYCGRCGTTHVPPSKGGTCPAMKEEVVEEGLADDVLAVAKGISPNARMRPSVADQKKKRDELIAKREKDAANRPKEASHTPYEKYPLGGYDPVSRRSYSEEVKLDESWMKQRSDYDGPGEGRLLGDMSEKDHVAASNYHGNIIHQLKTGTHKYSKMYAPDQVKKQLGRHTELRSHHQDALDAHNMKEEVSLREYVEQIDELSKDTLHSYIKKANDDAARLDQKVKDHPRNVRTGDDARRIDNRRMGIVTARMKARRMGEAVEIEESAMSDIHQTIGDHLDKHIAKYNAGKLGHDQFGAKVLAAHKAVAKEHGLQHKDAVKLVNDYVEGSLKEEVELVIDANALEEVSLREYVESDGLVEAYSGKGNHRPGWMLRADSALAAKIKEKQKARAALSKATKQPIKKDNDHE